MPETWRVPYKQPHILNINACALCPAEQSFANRTVSITSVFKETEKLKSLLAVGCFGLQKPITSIGVGIHPHF